MKKLILLSALAAAFPAAAETVTLTVSNPGDFARVNEIVEVDESAFKNRLGAPFFVLKDANGKEVEWQATHDGKIIFAVNLGPKEEMTYTAVPGIPAPAVPKAYGRLFKERADDVTWENDLIAYRAYGPALQRNGERAFGYDVWTKSVPELVLEERYINNNRRGKSFHKDFGNGMDVYAVGPTLGGGTAALLDDNGEIIFPWAYTDYTILDNGPLRFKVRLDYAAKSDEKGFLPAETRIITLDAGTPFNRTEVTWNGLEKPREVLAAQVVHSPNEKAYEMLPELNAATYADLTQNPNEGNGVIYVATIGDDSSQPVYMPLASAVGDAVGHVGVKGTAADNTPVVYYWGAGWSKAGVTAESWKETVAQKHRALHAPLKVKFELTGQKAPDFTLPTSKSGELMLSELKGKYVLLDFWASWCRDCVKANPEMVALAKKYKGCNLEIVGVSLDKERERWLKMISKDKLTWTQVSDLKGWDSPVAKAYGISWIPTTVLIAPDGTVIESSKTLDPVIKKLEQIFNR